MHLVLFIYTNLAVDNANIFLFCVATNISLTPWPLSFAFVFQTEKEKKKENWKKGKRWNIFEFFAPSLKVHSLYVVYVQVANILTTYSTFVRNEIFIKSILRWSFELSLSLSLSFFFFFIKKRSKELYCPFLTALLNSATRTVLLFTEPQCLWLDPVRHELNTGEPTVRGVPAESR